ncbi:MAG: CsbD family protein, partial [Clostridiaceae bacterium]
MNNDILKGKWNQYKGEAKKKWGELTDDELDQINGERDIIVGKIQEKYGRTKEEAEKEFDDWSNGLDRDN